MKKLILLLLLFIPSICFGQIFTSGMTEGTWTPTYTGFSADPTNGIYRYTLQGRKCCMTVIIPAGNHGTSNATTFTMTLPFTAATITNMRWYKVLDYTVNSGFEVVATSKGWIDSAGTIITLGQGSASGASSWGAASLKSASWTEFCYLIA